MNSISSFFGNDILEAVSKTGTPFYLYDAGIIRSRYKALASALPKGWNICFAVKANPNISVIRLYRELGAYAEVASAGEAKGALKGGYKPGEISFSGPVKTDREFSLFEKKSFNVIHAESIEELLRLNSFGRRQRVALRVNPDFSVKNGKSGVVMTGGSEKFGFSQDDALNILMEKGSFKNIDFVGFHVYMGTQILSADAWLKGAFLFRDWLAKASMKSRFAPRYINFGGGLGIPYREGEKEFDLASLKRGLKKMAEENDKYSELKGVKYFMEPGRYLCGPAGVYVMKVVSVKNIRGKSFALTDGGIHHALFPFRVSREFPVRLLNRKPKGKMKKYILGGPLCTTLDQSELPVSLSEVREGDILGIYNSGAYGYSASMNFFLSHPLPAEVLADGGTLSLIRKPSEDAHLFANQTNRRLA